MKALVEGLSAVGTVFLMNEERDRHRKAKEQILSETEPGLNQYRQLWKERVTHIANMGCVIAHMGGLEVSLFIRREVVLALLYLP